MLILSAGETNNGGNSMYNPIHEPYDKDKLDSMVAEILDGNDMPPILVDGDNALTGSHRIAAYAEAQSLLDNGSEGPWAELEVPAVEVDADELARAYEAGCDEPNDVCDWLYHNTQDQNVKKAVADQF